MRRFHGVERLCLLRRLPSAALQRCLAVTPTLPRRHTHAGATPTFAELVRPELAERLQRIGCVRPNDVQLHALSHALAGDDVIVSAQTGAGKTLSFLLPMLQRLGDASRPTATGGCVARPEGLVIVPTAELVEQIGAIAEDLCCSFAAPPSVGRASGARSAAPRDGATLLVATADEVIRRRREQSLCIDALRVVAIDEADWILCGQQRPAEEMADQLIGTLHASSRRESAAAACAEKMPPPLPQVLLSTATLSDEHEAALLRRFPTARRVSQTGDLVPTLRQRFHYFRGDKDEQLRKVLVRALGDAWLKEGSTLVFASVADEAERIRAKLLEEMRLPRVELLHEQMPTEARIAAVNAFRGDKTGLLVTTRLAARGLDFPHLRHVIVHAVELDVTSFIHCAGRTARRGETGIVTCLVDTSVAGIYSHRGHHALQPAPKMRFSKSPLNTE
ncbi:hypothetical protein AB1Y20_003112 [Prymnesium parvum]|uniref:ATP-dependent RNA helicase n=1 Tax=Prymnesium parvum TaxID=97485 RepID=A0AB34J9W7_PRYPA